MSSQLIKKTVANTDLFVREGQPEHTLVLLHGIGSNHTSFSELVKRLPKHYRLLIWNAPGYGDSQPLETMHPLAGDYANKLFEIVTELKISRFDLLGHSLGTLVAVAFAGAHSALLNSLILCSCAQGYGMEPGGNLPDKAAQRLQDLDKLGRVQFAAERAPRLLYQPDAHPELKKAAVDAMASINTSGYRQAVHMLAAGDCRGTANGVSIPTLVIVGQQDQITPPAQSAAVHDALNAAAPAQLHEYKLVADAGHLVHQQQPSIVTEHITDFLRQVGSYSLGVNA